MHTTSDHFDTWLILRVSRTTGFRQYLTHYVKLGKERRESSKRKYYIISPRVIIKAIIIITSQPWSDTTCPCTTSWSASAYFWFVILFLLKKARQSIRSGVTGARCVRPWLNTDIVWTGLFRRGWVRFQTARRSEVAYINSTPLTHRYLLALPREFSLCPRKGPYRNKKLARKWQKCISVTDSLRGQA